MSSVFGGSKSSQTQTSTSNNQAYPMLSGALGGQVTNGTNASNLLSGLFGGQGQDAANKAFDTFRNSTGYQFGMDQGSQAVTQNAATKGLLNSGSTAKALTDYGQNYANSQYQNFVNPLMQLVGSGNQAAGVIANAGQQSNSSSTSKSSSNNGLGGFIGQGLSTVASMGIPH